MASTATKKRKHPRHSPPHSPAAGDKTLTPAALKLLGDQLLSSRAHVNNLPLLLTVITPSTPLDLVVEALIPLQSFFTPLVDELPSAGKSGADTTDPEAVYWAWLRGKFDDFVNALIGIAVSPDSVDDLRDVAVDSIMEFVKLGKGGRFQSAIYHRLLHSIVRAASSIDPLLDLLATKYFKYIDVRPEIFEPVFTKTRLKIFVHVSSTGHISKKLKLKFTKAWMSFLKLTLPLDVYKEVLVTLRQNVIPYMANPAILCVFLTSSYDIGGVISVMALSGLFTLMTQYGLEYPKFYEKLYALLTPAVFMAKHRAVFFQLLDTCLKSSYLPAYLAAAFAKRLSRLSLLVPPQGALVIIATIHNLLRRHPSINFFGSPVNDEVDGDVSMRGDDLNEDAREPDAGPAMHSRKHGIYPFNNEETDPAKSEAMRSSLWEIETLRHHYCPAVSRSVASLENDLTVRAKTCEVTVADFSSGSYATIFGDEIRRRIKQVPLAFYKATPSSLFWESEFAGWAFGDVQSDKDNSVEENGVFNTAGNGDLRHIKRQHIESH